MQSLEIGSRSLQALSFSSPCSSTCSDIWRERRSRRLHPRFSVSTRRTDDFVVTLIWPTDRCTRTAAPRFEFGRTGSSDGGFAANTRSRRRSVSSGVIWRPPRPWRAAGFPHADDARVAKSGTGDDTGYPPAIAPMMRKGSAPATMASGSGASTGSWERSCSQAKKRMKGRRRRVP